MKRPILLRANVRCFSAILALVLFTALAPLRLCAADAAGQPAAAARVNVILWFDTEDYLLPADDDAAKRLAEMLTQRGIHATFKVVGEKARVLEQRGRTDVIAALQKHTIGYHSNFHSVHPTPTEYLAECGYLDGVAEFVRREARGAADVRRIFNVPSLACYGQPGSSWGAQAIAGLAQIGVGTGGVPCYVDSGRQVGLGGRPFWYCGALMVFDMRENETRMTLHDPTSLEPAKVKFTEIADRLRQGGGGLISIFYHPCEWVHKAFWDATNFRGGRNPPREQWVLPPQRTPEETEKAFVQFAAYIDHMRSVPGVNFVTAADLPALYPDRLSREGAPEAHLIELAKRLTAEASPGVDFQVIDGIAYSPADQLDLLASAVTGSIRGREVKFPLKGRGLLGPDGPPPVAPKVMEIPWPAFRDATLDAEDFLATQTRVPARVFIGPDAIATTDFLITLAAAYRTRHDTGQFAQTVRVTSGAKLLPEERIAKDTPNLFGGWVIHRPNFRAPKVLEVARQQTWTFKPAMPAMTDQVTH